MKIWHKIPLLTASRDTPIQPISPGQSTVGHMLTWDIPVFTRSRKVNEAGRDLENYLASPSRAPDVPLGLWVAGNPLKGDEIIRRWIAASVFPDTLTCLIRDINDTDLDVDDDPLRHIVNARTHIFLSPKFDPHRYEGLFYSLSRSKHQGIAIDVESVQRSIITLAQRFGLTSIVTGVVHERQEKIALSSGADAAVVL